MSYTYEDAKLLFVVFIDKSPTETAAATLLSAALGKEYDIVLIAMEVGSSSDESIEKIIDICDNIEHTHILHLGTYWWRDHPWTPLTTVFAPYGYKDVNDLTASSYRGRFGHGQPDLGVLKWTIDNYIKMDHVNNVPRELSIPVDHYLKSYYGFIEMMDERNRSESSTLRSQAFMAGAYTYPHTLVQVFIDIWEGNLCVSTVEKKGRILLKNHMSIVDQRVMKNSTIMKTSNGDTIAVTNAPEFKNLTHDSLYNRYSKVSMTATVYMLFTTSGSKYKWSLRSCSPSVSAVEYASKYGGGGNKVAAGFEVPLDIQVLF